jgi:hypothetical protein
MAHGIRHGLVGGHVANLNEAHGDQTGTSQAADGLGDEPLRVGLRDDDNGVALPRFQLVGALGLKVVHDNSIHHGMPTTPSRTARTGLC